MKKVIVILTVVMFVFSSLAYARGGKGFGGNGTIHSGSMGSGSGFSSRGASGPMGPAPNSGDCIPDGSGLDRPNGPNGTGAQGSRNGPMGPAPNSGDGVPDGSGFDAPNGPVSK